MIIQFWMILVIHFWVTQTVIQFWMIKYPFLDDANYHPILGDSSPPLLDDVNCHPVLDDSSHPLWMMETKL